MVSSGQYRWLYCPLVPEGSIKFSVMPSGMKFRFSHELLHQFSYIFFLNAEKNELDSDIYVRICGYHFYMYILLIILFFTKKENIVT